MLPIMVSNLRETFDDIIVAHLDGQLSAGNPDLSGSHEKRKRFRPQTYSI